MKTLGRLLMALSLLSAAPSQAQDVRDLLDEGRRALIGARLTATDRLQRTGNLPPEQLALIDDMIDDADKLWTACLIEYADRASSTPIPAPEIVGQAMAQCARDRDEMAAWIRLGGQAHHEPASEPRLNSFISDLEAEQRTAVRDRISRARGSSR